MTVTPEILWLAIAVLLILVVAFAIRLFQIVSRYRVSSEDDSERSLIEFSGWRRSSRPLRSGAFLLGFFDEWGRAV